MAVKDLVGLYESRSKVLGATPSPPSSSSQRERKLSQSPQPPSGLPSKSVESITDVPLPSAARFLTHPLLRRREPSSADQEDDPTLEDPFASEGDPATCVVSGSTEGREQLAQSVRDSDVTDQHLGESSSRRVHEKSSVSGTLLGYSSAWRQNTSTVMDDGSAIELNPLLSSATGSSTRVGSSEKGDSSYLSTTRTDTPHYPSSSTTTLVPPLNLAPHTPIPLSQILARNAAPVSLPKLDDYVSSLEMPSFPECHNADIVEGNGKGRAPVIAMFPPMERLAGTTLVDLENNAKVAPAWRNRQSIFSSMLNVALGITVRICRGAAG